MVRSTRFWLTLSVCVLLAHLLAFLALQGLLSLSFVPESQTTPLSVQLVAPPPSLPQQAAPRPGPLAKAAPATAPALSVPQSSTDSVADLPVQESFESSLEPSGLGPEAQDLIQSGGVAMTAYWGDHTTGSPIGRSVIELSFPQPDRYEVKMVTEAAGWARIFASAPMTAQARGRLGPNGFQPERYAHQGPRRSEVTEFDYQKEEIRYESLKEPLPLLKGIQDRLTFMLQLAWMLQANPEQFGLGQTVSLPIAGRNKVEQVDFVVLSDADLSLPGGLVVPALHLSSNRETSRYSVKIDVWMDRTDRLLPVRVRFEEARGAVLDLLTVRN